MIPLCIASFITATCYLIDSWFLKKRAWHSYVVMFSIMTAINFLFPFRADAKVSTESKFKLVSEKYFTQPYEVCCLLIHNGFKYNAYILDDYQVQYPIIAEYIVTNFESEPLDIAKVCFPEFKLRKNNYGFEACSISSPLSERLLYSD